MVTFFQGMGTGAGLIIAIGAQNAFVLSQGVKRQFVWLVVLICAFCDAVLIFAGAAGIGTVVAENDILKTAAAWGGALFLFYYGMRSLRSAISGGALKAEGADNYGSRYGAAAATLAVTLLNPHVYLDTVVLLGSMSGQYGEGGRYMFAFGASSASFLWFFALGIGGVILTPFFQSEKAWRCLDIAVCLTMWTIAAQLLIKEVGSETFFN